MFGALAGILGELGSLVGAAVLGLVALGLVFKGEEIAARLDVGPAVDVIEHVQPGLTAKEVEEFLTLHQEYLEMQEEKRDEMRKDAQQGHGSGRTLNKR